jgi:hypothetical protein
LIWIPIARSAAQLRGGAGMTKKDYDHLVFAVPGREREKAQRG